MRITIRMRRSFSQTHLKSNCYEVFIKASVFCLSLIGTATTSLSQGILSGRILSAKGELLAGVSITISGSTEGASSDSCGVYRIALPKKKNLLVFSAIGFQKKQTWIDSPGQLDVILSPNSQELSEVVVTSGLVTSIKRSNSFGLLDCQFAKSLAEIKTGGWYMYLPFEG